MYEEQIESLRYEAAFAYLGSDGERLSEMMKRAADAIEELQQTVEHYKGCADDWYKEACDYKAMVHRWIPVAERLPEGDDDVLIYGERTGASGAKYREIWLTDLKEFLHRGYKPIAWMTLPEPPKEETE